MLAGVDYVLMGAGIPARIPALLDRLVVPQSASMPVTVAGAGREHTEIRFDPHAVMEGAALPVLRRLVPRDRVLGDRGDVPGPQLRR
jgi:hypothetical protein